jgi:exopolysaccharide biosynthesis polyprenyl glycosylphosphotransferase
MRQESPIESAEERSFLGRVRSLGQAGPSVSSPAPSKQALGAGISPVWEVVPRLGAVSDAPGSLRLRHRDALLRRALGLSDLVAGFISLAAVLTIVPGPAVHLRPAAVLLAPFIILVSKALGLYDHDQYRLRKSTLDEAPALLHLALLYAFAVWLVQTLLVGGQLSREQVFVLAAASFVLMMLSRAGTRSLARELGPPERCLIVGNERDAETTSAKLARSSAVNVEIVGRAAITGEKGEPLAIAGQPRLVEAIRQRGVERVIIAPDGHDQDEVIDCIRLVKALGIKVSVLPRLLEVVGSSAVYDDVDGTALLGVRQYGLSKSSEILKRMTDVIGASLALAILAPLFVFLVIAVRLDSSGTAFFRQARIGRRGERFSMLKFRTMVRGADRMKDEIRALNEVEGGLFKITRDPRITRIGGFLRRTSLDELPQLFNVLRGEMSLVGPRPLVQDEDALIEGWERRRLAVKPGITGLWQIYGSSRILKPEMVKIDYLYGANWSIWLDLKILLRTVPYVLGRRGM